MKKEIITIPKLLNQNPVVNYDVLREEGLNHILDLGRKLWTDFNSHDPGVTTLEMLSYAISDLGYHINLPMEDLVAEKKNNFFAMHEKFLTALNVLPSCPITVNDYRKLFINKIEVNNVWVEKGHYELYANCEEHKYQFCKPDNSSHQKICLNGLYKFWVELKDKAIVYPNATNEDWTEAELYDIKKKLKLIYHQNRNLDEDLLDICLVRDFPIKICSNVELTADADLAEVIAQLRYKFKEYFSPFINHYSLKEMLDKGYSTDEIFEGTSLKNGEGYLGGFIDNEELNQSGIRRDLHVSDLIRIIMNTSGVKVVNDLHMGGCDDKEIGGDNKEWSMCIPEGYKPTICDKSVFNFFKDIIPLEQTEEIKKKAHKRFYELLSENIRNNYVETEDISFPVGTHYNLSEYHSIQNHFPDTYGINQIGLPRSVGEERLAMAKQMKGYLLFFDQILANYFSQLSKVKDLLSLSGNLSETYFTQVIKDVKGVEELWVDGNNIDGNIKQNLNQLSDNNERTNQLLDHLLARFAVDFNEYSLLMYSITENSESSTEVIEKTIIKNKIKYLNDFQKLSCERGKGFNYCNHDESVWDSDNVSGLEKRIAFLSGNNTYQRQSLAYNIAYDLYTTETGNFKFRITEDEGKTLLTSNRKYDVELEAKKDLGLLLQMLDNTDNVEHKELTGNKTENSYRLFVLDPTKEKTIASSEIFTSEEKVFEGKEKLIHFLNGKKEQEGQGGIFVVEHLLLRPVPALTNECSDENIFCKETNPGTSEAYEAALQYYNEVFQKYKEVEEVLASKTKNYNEVKNTWEELSEAIAEAKEVYAAAKEEAENAALEAIAAEAFAKEEGTEEAENAAKAAAEVAAAADKAEAEAKSILNDLKEEGVQVYKDVQSLGKDLEATSNDIKEVREELMKAEEILKNIEGGLGSEKEFPMFSLDNCGSCKSYDPYSFKISVVLPGWTPQFVNLDYRKFVEKTIRLETPAHILPKICFVSKIQMATFEKIYKPWLEYKNKNCCDSNYQIEVNPYTKDLIKILEGLKNYYPDRPILKGCSDSEGGHLFLGRTNL